MSPRYIAALIALAPIALPQTSPAQTIITVNTADDEDNSDGDCSCREALIAANTNVGRDGCPGGSSTATDTIRFDGAVVDTITLTLGELAITDSVVVEGPGAAVLAISGNDASRVFNINAAVAVTLSGLTITKGNAGSTLWDPGGGVRIAGRLTMNDCVVSECRAGPGGGLAAVSMQSSATLRNTDILNNVSQAQNGGGGIFLQWGPLAMVNCTVSGNETSVIGGGIFSSLTWATIDSCTISDNEAWQGGGISNNSQSNLTIRNSTVSGNRSLDASGAATGAGITNFDSLWVENCTISGNEIVTGGLGAGIGSAAFACLWVRNSTISGNTCAQAGGVAQNPSGSAEIYSTIIAGNVGTLNSPDVYDNVTAGTFVSNGYNLIGDVGLANWASATGDQVGGGANPVIDPMLGPLASNGGPTLTHTLLAGSPAIDAGDCTMTGESLDQRGLGRPEDFTGIPDTGDGCDIGAVELASNPTGVDSPVATAANGSLWNAPNPFRATTTVQFELARRSPVQLVIYDAAGRQVRSLLGTEALAAGKHSAVWDGRSDRGSRLAAGTYFLRLHGAGQEEGAKVLLVR